MELRKLLVYIILKCSNRNAECISISRMAEVANSKDVFCCFPSDPPKDNGGSDVTKYVVELSEGLSGTFYWGFLVCLHMLNLILALLWLFHWLCVLYVFSGSSWNQVYSGSAMECVCDGLSPGCSYQARVHCISVGGESPVCHTKHGFLCSLGPS